MQKEILLEIVKQNQFTSHFSLDQVSEENASLRLNDKTASIGFIYRHIGETMNLFGQFFGIPTDVINTTMGQTDIGQVFDVEYSRQLISRGYGVLRDLVEISADEDWLKPVDTPFFWYGYTNKIIRSCSFSQLASCRSDIYDPSKRKQIGIQFCCFYRFA
jgi:hypothetical protein